VKDQAACEALIGEIEGKFGAVTVLVNNAGITRDNLSLRMKDDEWDAVIDTNLKAVFRLSKLVMRGMMKARHGRIINITSVVGSSGNPVRPLRCRQGRRCGHDPSAGAGTGQPQYHGELRCPRLIDTDMTKSLPEHNARLYCRRSHLAASARPSKLPRQWHFSPDRAPLHHRYHTACQWRNVHDLKAGRLRLRLKHPFC